MIETLPRPEVSAERYRELEILEMQMALLMPSHKMDECLIIKDMIDNRLRRWFRDERLTRHETETREDASASTEGEKVIRLPRGDCA
jgi:hypothetical protein